MIKCTKRGLHFIHVPQREQFLLDLVPRPNSTSFINSFRRMIAKRGCPNNKISDNGKNFYF